MQDRLKYWEMLRNAIDALGGRATRAQIIKWINEQYQGINPLTLSSMIPYCCVNDHNRVHCPQHKSARKHIKDGDVLYRVDDRTYEKYDPKKHGVWGINTDKSGKPIIFQYTPAVLLETHNEQPERTDFFLTKEIPSFEPITLEAEPLAQEIPNDDVSFTFEAHLRDFIVENIASVKVDEKRLSLFRDKSGISGKEYRIDIGIIDILAVDEDGSFIVFELKLDRGHANAVGQLQTYMSWVKRHLAHGVPVKGVIVVSKASDKLKYAADINADVHLFEYKVKFEIKEVSLDS